MIINDSQPGINDMYRTYNTPEKQIFENKKNYTFFFASPVF